MGLAFCGSRDGAVTATGRKVEYGPNGREVGGLGGGKTKSLSYSCLIEGYTETFALERAKEGNEHMQCSQEKCSQAHSSPM